MSKHIRLLPHYLWLLESEVVCLRGGMGHVWVGEGIMTLVSLTASIMTILPTQCCPPDKASLQSHLPCISTEQVKFCTITVQSLGEHNRSEMIICFLTHRSNTGTRFTLSIFLFIFFKQGSFWWTSNCVLVILLLNTAETIFEDHSNNQAKVLLKQVWSLLKGSLTWKYDGKVPENRRLKEGCFSSEWFLIRVVLH